MVLSLWITTPYPVEITGGRNSANDS